LNQAVILAGGTGTRLGEITKKTPKPLVEVGGRPFIYYLIDEVARHGFDEILLLCGYLGDQFVENFEGLRIHGATVKCIVEEIPSGTAGALLQAKNFLHDEFLLLNGDSIFDFNFNDLTDKSWDPNFLVRVALRKVSNSERYGSVLLNNNTISSFCEKLGQGTGLINTGVYFIKLEILNFIQEIPCSLEKDIFPLLVNKDLLGGREYDGYFIDIGIPMDLEIARKEIPNRIRKTVFFDRDGVLNSDIGYTHKIEDFQWTTNAIKAIKLFNDNGWLVFVITNQSGVARGYYGLDEVINLHNWMQNELRKKGAHIDEFYFCPHHPNGVIKDFAISCECRKPKSGMLLQAIKEWVYIDIINAWMIGDKQTDIQAANNINIHSIKFDGTDLLKIAEGIVFKKN
jgi:D-glycero-D-manno-heptose 1,7-bisphosphate phosphatase